MSISSDPVTGQLIIAGAGNVLDGDLQSKIVSSGGFTYIGQSIVGTAEATAGWKVFRIEDATGSKLYADGDANFDNAVTDMAALTYSYT